MHPQKLHPVRELCQKKNILFADYSNNPKYVHNNEYSCDGGHLNAKGADVFTAELMSMINAKVQ